MMKFHFKNIHIGNLIKQLIEDREIKESRIISFLQISKREIDEMYQAQSMNTELLLSWSKLLEYDLFRVYSQHLVLYAPPKSINYNKVKSKGKSIPEFRKNVYTIEIINFILQLIENGEKKKSEIIKEYNIPKTTLYKWIKKHRKNGNT
jgi:hypothetical protein